MSDLSPTMQRAVEYAKESGGKIVRYPGGFWAKQNWRGEQYEKWYGTTTIQALVSRGVFEYTQWHEGRSRFPVEVTLKQV